MPGDEPAAAAAPAAAMSTVLKLPELSIKHDGNNHRDFVLYAEAALRECNLHTVLTLATASQKDQDRVFGWLIRHAEPHIARVIHAKKTPSAAWAELKARYEGDDAKRQARVLLKELVEARKQHSEAPYAFLERCQNTYFQLATLKPNTYSEEFAVAVALGGLSADSACSFVLSFINTSAKEPETFREAIALVRRSVEHTTETAALSTATGSRGRGRGGRGRSGSGRGGGRGGGAPGEGAGRGSGRGGGRGNTAARACFACGDAGHLVKDCPKLKNQQAPNTTAAVSQATAAAKTAATTTSEEPAVTYAYVSSAGETAWLVDTAASDHFTGNREQLTDYQPLSHPISVSTMGAAAAAVGRGTVVLRTAEGAFIKLKDVLYCPGASFNLLSVTQLVKRDPKVTLVCTGEGARLEYDGKLAARCRTRNGMYELDA